MSNTNDDLLQSIRGVIGEVVDTRITQLEKRMDAKFQAQTEQLSKAIVDAVKLIAASHPTKEEFQELKDEVDDLRERLQKIEHVQKTS